MALTDVTAGLNYNMCELLIKKKYKSQAILNYDTNVGGGAELGLLLSMERRQYDRLTNGLEPVDLYVWEAHKVMIEAVIVNYPAGYTMEAQPYFKQLTTRKKKDSTFPVFYMDLEVKVGPMIGSWTSYMHRITWDPRRPDITVN